MSEDKKEGGFFSQIKNQLIAGVGIVLTTLGGVFIDEVKSFAGIGDEVEPQTEVVHENNQSVNVQGPNIIINIPEQQPVKERVVIKEVTVPAKKKKEKEEEVDW